MLGIAALLALILPWIVLPAMAALIWLLSARRLRAVLALAALALVAASHSREFLYAIGLGLPHPDESPGGLAGGVGAGIRAAVTGLEGHAWLFLAFSALAAALLSWPPPERRGVQALAVLVVAGLGVSAALAWSLTGLRFN
jgi:hypothetical protein